MKEYLTAAEVAEMLSVKKRTFLERYAVMPDFPPRISITKKRFWWKGSEVKRWLDRRQESQPNI